MAIHSLSRVEIDVPNPEAAHAFYEDFGLVQTRPGWFSSRNGGEQLRVGQAAGPRREIKTIGIGVDADSDLQGMADRRSRLGVATTKVGDELRAVDPGSGVTVALRVEPRLAIAPERHPTYNGPS